jgi:hypothetical protein
MSKALLAGILALGLAGTAVAQGPNVRTRTISKNTKIEATVTEPISSSTNKIGDEISATIVNDVKDEQGNVIFPAGSPAKLRIIDLKAGDSKDKNGALALQVSSVKANDQDYRLNAPVDPVTNTTKKPGWTSDKKKMGIGAAAGAVVGGLATGNLKGALAGGVLGAVGGAIVTHQMNGREVVVASGSRISFTITEPLQVLVS